MFRDTPVKSRYVTTLVVPPSSGSVYDLFAFFPDKSIGRVDALFLQLVHSIGPDYRTPELKCFVYNLGAGNKDDEIRGSLDIIPGILDGHQICAILEHLGSQASDALKITDGSEEVNLILGYAKINGDWFVLFVEHELGDEIHLHAQRLDEWDSDDDQRAMVILAA